MQFGYWRISENGEEKNLGETAISPCENTGKGFLDAVFAKGNKPLPFPWCYAFCREFLKIHNIRFREDVRISEDFLFDMQAIPLAEKIIVTDERIVGYVERDGSATASLSVKKLFDNLNCKAEVFRNLQVSPIANEFMFQALRAAEFKGEDYRTLINIIKENKDIAKHVSSPTLKVANIFIKIFGTRFGIKIFGFMARIKRGK
jgi:hypothetical protein